MVCSRFLLALACLLAIISAASAQTVWLGPVTDQVTPGGFSVDPDYQELFDDSAPWQKAMARTRVFEIPRGYIATQPDANLRRIFAFFHRRNIALAVIFGFVEANGCGETVEGAAH